MQILVLNTGSSSVKFSLIEARGERTLLEGQADWAAEPAGAFASGGRTDPRMCPRTRTGRGSGLREQVWKRRPKPG